MGKKEFKKPKQEKGRLKSSPIEKSVLDNIEYPVFCFRHIQSSYCITKCNISEKAALITKLHIISKLSWNQIHGSTHKGFGCEKIPSYRIDAEIPSFITKDTTFLSFRFDEKNRFVGYREKNVLNLLWIGEPYSH